MKPCPKFQRIGLVVALTTFALLMTQVHAAPSEGTQGKVDETPLLEDSHPESRTTAPQSSAPQASKGTTETSTSAIAQPRAAVSADTPTAPASDAVPVAPAAPAAPVGQKSEPDLKNTVNSLREKLTEMESRVEELTRKLEAKEAARATVTATGAQAKKPGAQSAPPAQAQAQARAHAHAQPNPSAPAPSKGGDFDSIPMDETPAPQSQRKLETVSVPVHPGEKIGAPVPVRDEPSDPEMGFTNDSTIQEFRSAMILHKAGKYPEAVLAFSAFVENYPDHPLAGTAQFYVGDSYFKQKEYGLSVREFQRVLTTYDRSTHIAQTLREISDAEEILRKSEDAARHRQLLMSLFPHSPFTTAATAARKTTPAESPQNASQGAPQGKEIQ